jgi:hypothetical protein
MPGVGVEINLKGKWRWGVSAVSSIPSWLFLPYLSSYQGSGDGHSFYLTSQMSKLRPRVDGTLSGVEGYKMGQSWREQFKPLLVCPYADFISLLSAVASVPTWLCCKLVTLVTHQAWCPGSGELCRWPGRIGAPGHSHPLHAQSQTVGPTRHVHPQSPG